jgi:hypothetical protein
VIAGVLTYYLTPETFVAASVGEAVYTAAEATYDSLRTDLGLTETQTYVPLPDGDTFETRLFVPSHRDYTVPDATSLRRAIVVPDEPSQRGLAIRPIGMGLIEELEPTAEDAFGAASEPERVFEQVSDGLVEQFELADRIVATMEDETRCVIAVEDSVYGLTDGIDHPIASAFGVGAATALETPVEIAVSDTAGDGYTLECRWGTARSGATDD